MAPNEAVEKVGEGLCHPNFGGLLTIPRQPIGPQREFCEVDYLGASSKNFRKGFFYSFNVELRCLHGFSRRSPRTQG